MLTVQNLNKKSRNCIFSIFSVSTVRCKCFALCQCVRRKGWKALLYKIEKVGDHPGWQISVSEIVSGQQPDLAGRICILSYSLNFLRNVARICP
jgi:hypothetical protein